MYAEWENQKGIVLVYPHRFCDFRSNLDNVQDCFDNIIVEIAKREDVYIIAHPNDESVKHKLNELLGELGENAKRCKIFEIESNDLWARDYVAVSVRDCESSFANFNFNGWGLKFRADLDNQINEKLRKIGFFDSRIKNYGFVLEGGSIDYNGDGILLTTEKCLLEPNRNPHLNQSEIERMLKTSLNVRQILWLKNGHLLGDDTDSHIDTLARFISKDTIAYVKCDDLNNPHFSDLNAMEHELGLLAKEHKFNLVALPYCDYVVDFGGDSRKDSEAKYLPASYVNFLFINEKTLLLPIYNKSTDFSAIEILKNALPEYQIIPIKCETLIQEHGSLHCVTMQVH